jgi:hypothetical protein
MKINLSIYLVFLMCIPAFSQHSTINYNNLQTDFFYGFLIEHDKSLNEAIQGNPYGFLVSYNRINTTNNKFNELYNYPERGFSFLYENFNSTILGEAVGLYRHYTYNLTPSQKNHLKLTTAFGAAYATNPYDAIENNKNFALGTSLLASAFFKLQYLHFFKNNNLSLNSALSITHFSNIGFQSPNLGINTIALNLGLNYKLNEVMITKKDTLFTPNKTLKYHLIFRAGANESKVTDSGLFPFFTATFNLSKNINNYSTLALGADYFYAEFLKEYSTYINNEEYKNYTENNANRVGIFVGHQLTQNHFAFITQLGFYVYQPVFYESWIYERIGFQYKLSNHILAELTLKANLFRAEALEFGLGYTF